MAKKKKNQFIYLYQVALTLNSFYYKFRINPTKLMSSIGNKLWLLQTTVSYRTLVTGGIIYNLSRSRASTRAALLREIAERNLPEAMIQSAGFRPEAGLFPPRILLITELSSLLCCGLSIFIPLIPRKVLLSSLQALHSTNKCSVFSTVFLLQKAHLFMYLGSIFPLNTNLFVSWKVPVLNRVKWYSPPNSL